MNWASFIAGFVIFFVGFGLGLALCSILREVGSNILIEDLLKRIEELKKEKEEMENHM